MAIIRAYGATTIQGTNNEGDAISNYFTTGFPTDEGNTAVLTGFASDRYSNYNITYQFDVFAFVPRAGAPSLTAYKETSTELPDGDDLIDGGLGSDALFGGGGNDSLFGGRDDVFNDGDDVLFGGWGNDLLVGGNAPRTTDGGNDYLNGGPGRDTIIGMDGNDEIDTGNDDSSGNDSVDGGIGNDTIYAGAGNDSLSGGNGIDIFDYALRGFDGYGSNAVVQTLDGGLNPDATIDKSQADLLVLPGSPSDYSFDVNFESGVQTPTTNVETTDSSLVSPSKITLTTKDIELVKFAEPIDNEISSDNVLLEMVQLANESYGPQPTLSHNAEALAHEGGVENQTSGVSSQAVSRGWHALSAMELGIKPAENLTSGLKYSLVGGHYQAITPSQSLFGDTPEANALILTGMLGGQRTLALAFRGTDQKADFADYVSFTNQHFAKYQPLLDAVDAYIADPANGIQQVLITGHSLGAGIAQSYMAEHQGDARFRGLTIGSPGSDNPGLTSTDTRIVNFAHTSDPVASLAPVLSSDTASLEITRAGILSMLTALGTDGLITLADADALRTLLADVQPKDRQGSTVFINSDVVDGVLGSILNPFGEHDRDLYFKSIEKLMEAAGDVASPFYFTDLAQSLRNGSIYSGADLQVAVGDVRDPFEKEIHSVEEDDYVLGNFFNNRIYWDTSLLSSAATGYRVIDGFEGNDSLVLPGSRSSWQLENQGTAELLHLLRYKGTLVGDITRIEKLIFPRWFLPDEVVPTNSVMASFSSFTAASITTGGFAAAATATDGPVVKLDGTSIAVQIPTVDQTKLIVDPTFDYTDVGDGSLAVSGSGQDDIIVYGTGQKTILGGAGNDIISSNATAVSTDQVSLEGGSGDDLIYGGGGVETLIYSGASGDYIAAYEEDGSVAVFDKRSGSPDGSDTVSNVELFQFTDKTFTLAELIPSGQPGNTPPVAGDDTAPALRDTPLTLAASTLLSNDTDSNGDTLSITGVSSATNGTAVFDETTQQITFTPDPGYSGPASFIYAISDGNGGVDSATVNITVNASVPTNEIPVAAADSYSTDEDTALTTAAPGLLANDTDADGNQLTAVTVSNPANGTLTLSSDGSFTYTPNANYNGSDSFTYQVNDGTADSAPVTVTLTVNAVNDDPSAVDDSAATTVDQSLVIAAADLLTNDTDADNDALSITGVSGAVNGAISFDETTQEITFTPEAGYVGSASFTYAIADGNGGTAQGTVNVTVDGAPSTAFTVYNPSEASPADLVNAILAPSSGVTIDPASVQYSGSADQVSFYKGSLSQLGIGPGILLTSGDGTPAQANTSASYSVETGGGGDADLNAVLSAAGRTATTVDAGYLQFSFAITDPSVKSVSFDIVFGSEEYPEYVNSSYVDVAGVIVNGTNYALFNRDPTQPLSVLQENLDAGNFIDNGGGTLPIEYDGVSARLTVSSPVVQGTNTIKIAIADTGDDNYDSGLFVSNLRASTEDTGGGIDPGGNQSPISADDSFTTGEDTTLSDASVLANDTDVDDDTLTVTEVDGSPANVGTQLTLASGALLTVQADGSVAYDPNGAFDSLNDGEIATDTFTYTVSDGNGGTDTATATVTINGETDAPVSPPVANDDNVQVFESEGEGDIDGDVRENDTNPGGTPLPVSTVAGNAGNIGVAVAGSDGGLFTINADGTFDFDANGEFEHLGAGETATTEITYGITFTGAAAVVDVMLLQDLSGSFNEDLPNLRSQFGPLFDTLNEGRDVQFGVAGYVDKPFPPFGNAGDYVYETNLAVSGDKAAIQAALDSLTIGSGGDTPEAQLEALLQVAVRATGEVGFREGAQRIVVLSTDALPHLAGDYTTGANGANDGDAVVGDEDYPSIAQLKAALEEANITPVFSVTADVLTSYQNLVNELGRGVVVELSSSSDNLASAITDALGSVETTDEATLTVTVEGEADPPVASDDSFSTSEDTALSAVSVLANDTDVDDDTLTVTEVNGSPTNVGTQVTLASGALLTVQADGSVAYDPNGAFDSLNDGETATDTFTYTVSDGNGGTDTATASITINGATDAPVSPPSIVLSKSVKIIDIDILRAEHCDNHERHDGKWHGGDHAKHNDDGDKPSVLAKVAYSFEVRNTSADPTDAELKLTSLIDDNGTPDDTSDDFDVADIQKAFIGGDKDCDGLLDVGEVWKFKVTDKVHLRPGTEIVNSAVASALDSDGNAATSLDQASLGLDDIQIVHKARSGSQTERGEEGLRDVFELNANHCGADVIRSFLVADGDAFDFKGSRLKDASVEDGSLALKAGAKGDLTIWANTDKDAVLEKVALVKDFFEDNADALEGLGIDAEGLHGTLSTEVAKPILAAVVKSDLLWA